MTEQLEHQDNILAPPPEGSVWLLTTYVSGTRYFDVSEGEVPVEGGMQLRLHREPDNEWDEHAVAVHLESGEKIGYVPRRKNTLLARLMDGEERLFGRIERLRWSRRSREQTKDRLSVEMSVFLDRDGR